MDALIPASMSIGAFGLVMPRLPDVRAAGPGSSVAADVRLGQAASAVIIIGIGAMVAATSGNKNALWIAVAIVVLLAGVFEFALRIDPAKGVTHE